MPFVQSQAGVQNLGVGASSLADAIDRQGAKFVSEVNARYYALTAAGLVFRATGAPYTIVATTDISPMPVTTGVPIIGILNPQGSGVNAVILKHSITTTSGTPGGPLLWNYILSTSSAIAGTITPVNTALNGAGSKVVCFGSSATSPAFTKAGVLFGIAQADSAAAAGSNVSAPVYEEDAGDIIVPPGAFLGVLATAAGTAHIVVPSMEWAELPA